MQDLSKYSLAQLRALEVQVIEELKTRHYLSVSKAREQILYIAQTAGVSVEKLMASKGPRASKADKADKASKAQVPQSRRPGPAMGWARPPTGLGENLDRVRQVDGRRKGVTALS
jgi:DNA-binding protein H-NS